MSGLIPELTLTFAFVSLAIAMLAGIVKGLVGFAMPMILISGLSSVIAPELALAGLILPTLVTNGVQALRQGAAAAVASVKRFGLFLGVGLVALLCSAQLVAVLPTEWLLLGIGLPITLFAMVQLAGWQLHLRNGPNWRTEAAVGSVAGFIGGLSGVWGPPTVAYLTAIGTEKREQMRVQGVIYGLGAVALAVAHVGSGIVTARSLVLSALLVPPALLGMWMGGLIQDRINQAAFRKATLVVLFLAGLNLIRRAVMG